MFKDEIKEHLLQNIIPFWTSMKDDVNGGYYGWMDYDLTIDKEATKGGILNSRILWFFTNAAECLQDPSLLVYAKHAYDFMLLHCLDYKNGGIYWSVSYDGCIEDSMKHTYNQAFGIYALASYYEATKEVAVIELALQLFHLIEDNCRDEMGYLEAFDQEFHPVSNEKLSENGVEAKKTMNTILHVFEAYTELYRVSKDNQVKERLLWILDVFETKIYNAKEQKQEVFFDENMNSIIEMHSYGHDIETAWLLDRGCEILKEEAYSKRISKITKALTNKIYEVAYRNHSVLNESCNGVVDTSRIWWVQAEAMVGFMNGYQKDQTEDRYRIAVQDIWTYIKAFLIDHRAGSEWLWEVNEAGEPNRQKPILEPWKCPYHNGRMCIEILRRDMDVT